MTDDSYFILKKKGINLSAKMTAAVSKLVMHRTFQFEAGLEKEVEILNSCRT